MAVELKVEDLYKQLELALNSPEGSITRENAGELSFTLDSMGAVLLTSFFDSDLGIVVDAEQLMTCHSVNDLLQLVDQPKT
jgi:acyl carrier protein